MPTSSTPITGPPSRKGKGGMRKGTHSCYECRKRKVRCIFAKDSAICNGCIERDRTCTEQRRDLLQAAGVETGESLRERVAKLEAIIEASKLVTVPVETSICSKPTSRELQPNGGSPPESSSSSANNPTPASSSSPEASLSIDRESSQNIDPMVNLFHNAIWRSQSSNLAPGPISQTREAGNPAASKRRMRTRELLVSDSITPDLLGMVMHATCFWWHTWRPLGPWLPASIGEKDVTTLPDFVLWALESPDPSVIGLAMLCIGVCLQQLDTRVHQYIIRQLPRPPGTLFHEYFEKVDRLIINDSDYASTEEGIETIIMAAKIYMNLGLNRKCWLLTHQAITYGQLLGFHRPERLTAMETPTARYRRNQSWLSLCAEDVYCSLLLGMPYAADGRTIPIVRTQHTATSQLQRDLTLLSARVIDRNQMGLSLSAPQTDDIQKEIETATKNLSEDFWNPNAPLAAGKIERREYLERIAAQCWYYQVLVLLHMPLMIHSVKDSQLEKYRTACLEASRNLLKVHHLMRSDSFSAFCMFKLVDHQAFVCSVLLVLGILGYGSSTQEAANRQKDRELINSTIATLRQTSGTVNNPIASQAVQGLETLTMLSSSGCPGTAGTVYENPYATLVVPYVGVITISPGEHYENRAPESTHADTHTPLEFSLSNHMLLDSLEVIDQYPLLDTFEGGQASGIEEPDIVRTELASIDFDWTALNTHNFEDDWAWLNDLAY